MANNTNVGEKIWEVLVSDAEFTQQPEGVQEVLKPYILQMPDTLNELMQEKVTLQVLMDAKMRFLKHAIEGGFVEDSVNAMPEDSFGFMDREDAAEMLQSTTEALIEILIPMVEDTPGFLKEMGISEEQVMSSSQVGFNEKNLAAYQDGALTIEDVLLSQPAIIIKNTD